MQLGYVTLFASAFPLASLISILANWVEVRSDALKLAFCQRPITHRAAGLGMWRTLFSCLIWMSALTNCLIVGYTSDQLVHYIPRLYIGEATGYREMGHEKVRTFVFFCWLDNCCERLRFINSSRVGFSCSSYLDWNGCSCCWDWCYTTGFLR